MQSIANQPLWLSIGQAAKYLGVSRDTLRRWEKRGKIKATRSPTNRRYYLQSQLNEAMKNPLPSVSVKAGQGFLIKRGWRYSFGVAVSGFLGFLAAVVLFFLILWLVQ